MGNWRWATWLIVGWTVLMAVLMVVIYPEVPNTESYNPPPGDDTAAYQAGVAFGVALIYWVIGMIVLGPIWYFTRKRLLCPVCGNKVGANARMCGRCGYVPGMAFPQGAYPPQQPGWPPQAQQPGWPPQAQQSGWPPQAQQSGWPPQAQQPGWPPQAQQSGWPQPQQPPPPQQSGWPQPQQPPQSPQSGWPPPPPPPTSGE